MNYKQIVQFRLDVKVKGEKGWRMTVAILLIKLAQKIGNIKSTIWVKETSE